MNFSKYSTDQYPALSSLYTAESYNTENNDILPTSAQCTINIPPSPHSRLSCCEDGSKTEQRRQQQQQQQQPQSARRYLIRLEQICENAINLVRNNARHSKYFFLFTHDTTKTETDR